MKNVINATRRFASTAGGKVAAGASALMASGAAFASGGGSPGSAIQAELGSGKADVMLVIGAVAVILGALILWGYVKRAR